MRFFAHAGIMAGTAQKLSTRGQLEYWSQRLKCRKNVNIITTLWNTKVSGKLQRLGIANLAYYSEWTAPKLKHYEQPTEPEQRLKVYQFEDEGRVCHRCQKVKSGCFYSPIRGTEMRSVSGILKALARTTLCILCANREMPTVDGKS